MASQNLDDFIYLRLYFSALSFARSFGLCVCERLVSLRGPSSILWEAWAKWVETKNLFALRSVNRSYRSRALNG